MPRHQALVLFAITVSLALAVPALYSQLAPPATNGSPATFDVISIHPVDLTKDTSAWGYRCKPASFWGYQLTPSMMIWAATGIYDLHRIKGVPGWASINKYDIDAKNTEVGAQSLPPLTDDAERKMLLSILASQFGYTAHYESADRPVLALVAIRGDLQHAIRHPHNVGSTSADHCAWKEARPGYLKAEACTVSDLAKMLNPVDDLQVLDQSGLPDRYDFELHYDSTATSTVANGWTTPVTDDPGAKWPSLYVALREQLGLKLKPAKAELPVLVVDHLVLPSEN